MQGGCSNQHIGYRCVVAEGELSHEIDVQLTDFLVDMQQRQVTNVPQNITQVVLI